MSQNAHESNDLNDLLFQNEDILPPSEVLPAEKPFPLSEDVWKVMIVDDEEDIHCVTHVSFRDFEFENKKIQFYSAHSAEEARRIIQEVPDMALILLDVVMEEDDSGLKFVRFLRDELKNHITRVILRTGQPGLAPANKVIMNYDINDYKEKTELTHGKFSTAMIMGLRSYRDLLLIEKSKQELSQVMRATQRFIPQEFLKELNKSSISDIQLGDHVQLDMTVLFFDIRGYTATSELLDSDKNFTYINNLIASVQPAIIEQGGFIDKYIGDSIMALFSGPKHAYRAVLTSNNLLKALKEHNLMRTSTGETLVNVGISIHTGMVTLGTIGFHDRMDCTVISDIVNTAAKLEKMNKILRTRQLITENVYAAINETEDVNFNWRLLGHLPVPGKLKLLSIVEVYENDPEEIKQIKTQTLGAFNTAVSLYAESHYTEARKQFNAILAINPEDTVSDFFVRRCLELENR